MRELPATRLLAQSEGGVCMTAQRIGEALGGRKCGSNSWMCRCPAHEDRSPSLHVSERNGRTLCHCFAGCSQAAVIEALRQLGLWNAPDLSPHERIRRRLDHAEQAMQRRAEQRFSDTLDSLKLDALESGNWKLWKTICRAQGR